MGPNKGGNGFNTQEVEDLTLEVWGLTKEVMDLTHKR
jgi:hypothetical protein